MVEFKSYDKTPIPLEVLKQINFSVKENHFSKIEIWYDDKTPDPFAIGYIEQFIAYNRNYDYLKDESGKKVLFSSKEECKSYSELIGFPFHSSGLDSCKKYLIARWADEIRPLNELKDLAKTRLLDKYAVELKKEIDEKTAALKQLTENVALYLNGDISESQLKGSKW